MYVTSLVISELYNSVSLSPRHRGGADCITVPALSSRFDCHAFHRWKLESKFSYIFSVVKRMLPIFMHSKNPKGAPWVIARRLRDGDVWELETIEKLLAMAIALDIVYVLRTDENVNDIPCIIIYNDRMRRMERMKPPAEQRKCIAKWKF